MADRQTLHEPWPWAIAAALATMIAAGVAFLAIALAYPDPPVDLQDLGLRATEGYVAPRGAEGR
jgi:hypothetical protein